jgi:hypothetical protein
MNSILILCASCLACSPSPTRNISPSFYYWKTVFSPTAYERTVSDSLQVQSVYLRYFDVAWNPLPIPRHRGPRWSFLLMPWAGLRQTNRELIPVVFITNECLAKMDSLAAIDLGGRILQLVTAMDSSHSIGHARELQIDCDLDSRHQGQLFRPAQVPPPGPPRFAVIDRYHSTASIKNIRIAPAFRR